MRKKNILNISLQLTAVISCIILAIGFVLSMCNIVTSTTTKAESKEVSTKPTIQDKENNNYIVSIGDSLTRGIGDEQGLGYIGIIRQQLAKQKQPIQLSNLAVSGQTSSQLVEQLKQKQIQQMLSEAQWISMTIGGNDLKNSIEGMKLNLKQAEMSKKAYAENLRQILQTIRTQNKTAPIFLFSLYNPYGDLADQKLTSETVLAWNQTMQQVAAKYPEVIMIPTFDLFQLEPNKYLSSDHFHPNHQGYQRFAARLMQVIQDIQRGGQ